MIVYVKGLVQLVVLLGELAPVMLKLWQEWQRRNGRLTADERRRLSEQVKVAVANKDTTDLEQFLTGKGREP